MREPVHCACGTTTWSSLASDRGTRTRLLFHHRLYERGWRWVDGVWVCPKCVEKL